MVAQCILGNVSPNKALQSEMQQENNLGIVILKKRNKGGGLTLPIPQSTLKL